MFVHIGRRKLHNDELSNLSFHRIYYWDNNIKEGEMGRTCSGYGKVRNAPAVLIGNPEGKDQGKIMRCWEDNTKMVLTRKQGWRVWIGLIWLRIGSGCSLL
jgi:hypothetical protein